MSTDRRPVDYWRNQLRNLRGATPEQALTALVQAAQGLDDIINDMPNNGRNARAPTGDDYNHLYALLDLARLAAQEPQRKLF